MAIKTQAQAGSIARPVITRPTPRPSRQGKFLPFWLLLPAILVLLVIQVYPTLYSFYMSLTRPYAGNLIYVGLSNFQKLFADSEFLQSLGHTAVYAGLYLVLTISLGLWLAVLINRRIRFSGIYLILLFIPWVISDVVAGTIWRWMFEQSYGILQYWLEPILHNTLFTNPTGEMAIVVTSSVWRALAFTILLFLGALQTVPTELNESAAIDGANGWQSFWAITFPLIRPTFVIAILLTSIRGINSLGLILTIMGRDGGPGNATETASLYLYNAVTRDGDFGRGAAVAVLLFAVNVALTALYLRFVTGGSRRQVV